MLIGSNQAIFQYRYVLLKEHEERPVNWERGVDRIADLKILPEIKMFDILLPKNVKIIKSVQLADTWQKYDLNLTVFHPILDQNEQLRLQGSADGLGNWDHGRFE